MYPPAYISAGQQLPMGAPFYAPSAYPATIVAPSIIAGYPPFQSVNTLSTVSAYAPSVKQQSRAEVVARTVHLRCLPPLMQQKELAAVFDACGEYLRVRICGNAATHQKWVYGFVEFATTAAAAAMLTHSGMELSNGPDKPPLRLKCSPSKQPILDCMAYDADVVAGTPCGFGRGYLAECTLNDALLVVGNGAAASATGGGGGGAGSGASANGTGGAKGGAAGTPHGNRTSAATRALTALTVSSIRKVAATGCGCGCSGVNCCGCCHCWKGEKAQEADGAAATTTTTCCGGTESTTADSAAVPGSTGGGCCGCGGDGTETPAATTAAAATADKSEAAADGHLSGPQADAATPTATSATFADLSNLPTTVNAAELHVLQQLAAAFQGLRSTAAGDDGQLDGPAIVRRAETMTLEALTRASHLSSDTRLQDILCDLTQLLSFLDANAALTGGAAQTASGDCTATLPQRVTQMRLLANLVGALLCLLRRSVADAVPYVEAVLVTFAQIPPSSLLLRARQHEKGLLASKAATAAAAMKTQEAKPFAVFGAPGEGQGEVTKVRATHNLSAFPLGALMDDDVTDGLLDLLDEDDDEEDGSHKTPSGNEASNPSPKRTMAEDVDEAMEVNTNSKTSSSEAVQQYFLNGGRSSSSCSDESTAYLNSADMADLCRRDEAFTRYVLNAVVAIGIAMEGVQPMIARSAYTLANARAAEVLNEPSAMLTTCLASPAASGPRLCEMLFSEASKASKVRDITFFPHRFFESVNAVRQSVRETRGTECFWRRLPPNHVVPLFKC